MSKIDSNNNKDELTRRDFLRGVKTGMIGFGIYSLAPSLLTMPLSANQGKSNNNIYKNDLSDGLGFYNLIRKDKSSSPLYVTLDIQPSKNLNRKIEVNKEEKDLTSKEIYTLIDQMSNMKVLNVCFLGKKPFSNPLLLDYIEYAEKNNISTSATSSGFDLNDADINRLSQIPFFNIKLNLEGATADTHDMFWDKGSFEVTTNVIEKCVKKNIKVTVVTYVTKLNYGEIPKIIELSNSIGANTYNLRRYIAVDKESKIFLANSLRQNLAKNEAKRHLESIALNFEITSDQAKELIKLQAEQSKVIEFNTLGGFKADKDIKAIKKDFNIIGVDPFGGSHQFFVDAGVMSQNINKNAWNIMCQSGATYCHITSTGKVIPCTWLPIACGDIRTESFELIWKNSLILKKLRGRESFDECIAHAFNETGVITAADPLKWN